MPPSHLGTHWGSAFPERCARPGTEPVGEAAQKNAGGEEAVDGDLLAVNHLGSFALHVRARACAC